MKRFGSISAFGLVALALFVPAERASAEPTPDQIAAIKANCRSDFMSKCWGVPRGGAEAMQCLKKNMATVSPGCQQALKAITATAPAKAPAPAPAIAKPEPAPAPQPVPETTAKPAAPATPAEPTPETAATSPASESAPSTPPKAAATPAPKPATETPVEAKVKEPATVEEPAAAAKPAAPPTASEETTIIGFIPPRKKLMILRNCRQDIETHCPDVSYGEGRQLSCLVSHKASLSADCQGALAKLTR
ncbi:MAG TPA: cysteine rich repeat-containing protein [Methyloceanibacter sp.]|nr:cysteine rich repeat-containing protein [Methyloceanibacter sp.]